MELLERGFEVSCSGHALGESAGRYQKIDKVQQLISVRVYIVDVETGWNSGGTGSASGCDRSLNVMTVQVEYSARNNRLEVDGGRVDFKARVAIPDDGPFAALLVDNYECGLGFSAFDNVDARRIDAVGHQGFQLELAKAVRSDVADIPRFETKSRKRGHCSGRLAARRKLMFNELNFGIEFRVVRHKDKVVDRVQPKRHGIEWLLSGDVDAELHAIDI